MIAPATYLMRGPLLALPSARERMVARMAADLFARAAFADTGDAMRMLLHLGYDAIDISVLLDEAIYLAKQQMVAQQMSEP